MPSPFGPQPPDHVEEQVRLALGQRRGRLVEDDDPRRGRGRPGDGDDLALRDRERLRRSTSGSRVTPSRVEKRRRLAVHARVVDQAEPADRLPAEEDVLGDGEIGLQVQLLVHRADAERLRLRRGGDRRPARPSSRIGRVGPVDAADDLDQRRFAGAVLAEQRMHLARRGGRSSTPSSARTPGKLLAMSASSKSGSAMRSIPPAPSTLARVRRLHLGAAVEERLYSISSNSRITSSDRQVGSRLSSVKRCSSVKLSMRMRSP